MGAINNRVLAKQGRLFSSRLPNALGEFWSPMSIWVRDDEPNSPWTFLGTVSIAASGNSSKSPHDILLSILETGTQVLVGSKQFVKLIPQGQNP